MARFKIILEYEGTKYYGWQYQKDQRTLQGILYGACRNVFNTNELEFYGAGRTDAGVHALAQTAHLEVNTDISTEMIKMHLNDELPADINILSVEKAHKNFHARYDAGARSYVYVISKRRTAFAKKLCWWIKDRLNVNEMLSTAKLLTGFHDFKNFCSEDQEAKSTEVEVQHINIFEQNSLIIIHIVASHFLWKMVRRIVGVLVEVGRGKMKPIEVKQLLHEAHDNIAQYTAPPSGLYLERVYYAGEKVNTNPQILINI